MHFCLNLQRKQKDLPTKDEALCVVRLPFVIVNRTWALSYSAAIRGPELQGEKDLPVEVLECYCHFKSSGVRFGSSIFDSMSSFLGSNYHECF